MKETFSINLGAHVRDTITGFRGVVTARIEYLTGCRQYTLTPTTLHDAKPIPSEWFDESRLEDLGQWKSLSLPVGPAPAPGPLPVGQAAPGGPPPTNLPRRPNVNPR